MLTTEDFNRFMKASSCVKCGAPLSQKDVKNSGDKIAFEGVCWNCHVMVITVVAELPNENQL